MCQRPDEIIVLAEHLISQHCQRSGSPVAQFTEAARNKLSSYQWPGNVRELDNVIQRALILSSNELIDTEDLLIEQFSTASIGISALPAVVPDVSEELLTPEKLGNELKHQEHQIILDTLYACHGSRKAVAERLGISPRTLRYKIARMRENGIEIPA